MRVKWTGLVLAGVLSAGCATSGPNKGEFNLISVDQEQALGKQFNRQVHDEMKVIDAPAETAYLQRLGERIVAGAPKTPFDFTFHIVEDEAVNAFTAPGGHIYVNTGLIRAVDSEAELAGVLAHEIAHAVERHVTEQMSKMYGAQALASLALGNDPSLLQQLVAQVGGTAVFMKFSRDAEREADEKAVSYLVNAGIDPRGLTSFFEELAKEGGQPPRFLAWLQSHPLTRERIKDTKARIAKLDHLDRLERDSAAFHAWKADVRA